jgi:hypothetical protein
MRAYSRLSIVAALMLAATACQDQGRNPTAPEDPPGAGRLTPELHKGFILRDGVPVEVTFEARGGRAIFEGDIDLGPADRIPRTVEELQRNAANPEGPRYGVVTSNPDHRWTRGEVAYVIDADVPNPSRITDALNHIQSQARGVYFVPRTSQANWIIFRRETDPKFCGQSPVGRITGGQVVTIGDTCDSSTATHEVLHSLGFWHEQSRCDRDSYVEIVWANVDSAYAGNFNVHCTGATTVFAYDETSIMHYHRYAFSVNGLPTIRSRRGLDHLIGSGRVLSTQDVNTIGYMYTAPTANISGPAQISAKGTYSFTLSYTTVVNPTITWYERSCTTACGAWSVPWYNMGQTFNRVLTPVDCPSGPQTWELKAVVSDGRTAEDIHTVNLCKGGTPEL